MKADLNKSIDDLLEKVKQLNLISKLIKPFFDKIDKKFKDLNNWDMRLTDDFRLLIINHNRENEPITVFLNIVKFIESITKEKMKVSFDDWLGKDNEYVSAECSIKLGDNWINIEIRTFNIEKCEIEYKEVITRKAKLSGFCAELLKQ